MKKIFILCLLCSLSIHSKAQSDMKLAVGYGAIIENWLPRKLDSTAIRDYGSIPKVQDYGALTFAISKPIHTKWDLGFKFIYYQKRVIAGNGRLIGYNRFTQNFSILANTKYLFSQKKNWNWYANGSFGVKLRQDKIVWNINPFNTLPEQIVRSKHIDFELSVGVQYKVAKRYSIYTEAGFAQYLIQAGFTTAF